MTGALAAPVAAQEPAPPLDVAPAHISLVDGVAVLERDGEPDDSPANMPLLAGDRLRTRAGRLEVLFADGATLHLDHHTVIDLQSDDLVRLIEGRIRLSIPPSSRDVAYRIDGPQGWATIAEPGEYRLATLNGPRGRELELVVLRGRADLVNEGGQTPLRAGERALVRAGEAPSYPYVANSAAWDAFDRWSEARRDERLRANAEYLPDEVRPYAATLEQHGYWRQEPTYGAVWYPRVQPDWRPYYRGRWVSLRPYGWTWVAYDPWGWPTHHYGRWGHSGSAWFWIPGRTWGAAWVSWATAGDYISWCPLGWNNRPVFQINIGIGRGYDPWRGWTVIPRRHLGYGYVHRYVVHGDRLDHRIRTSFAYRDRGPDIIGRAVPRSAAPIRVAGTRSGRGGAPLYTNVDASRSRAAATGGERVTVPNGARMRRSEADRSDIRGSDAPRPGENTVGRAVPRTRAVPDRPMVRSERSEGPGLSRGDSPTAAEPATPSRPSRSILPRETPRDPSESGARPRAVPRSEPRSSAAPDRQPSEAASYSRPSASGRARGADSGASPPVREASPRAVPRVERGEGSRAPGYRRPSESPRPAEAYRPAPAAERRGAEPRASGSYERRGPAASAPPRAGAPSRGDGTSPPGRPAGARPRPSGGGN